MVDNIKDVDFDALEAYVPVNQEDLFAKEQLRNFVFLDIETNLVFVCPRGEGKKIIQRMRVRLSKLRKTAIKRQRVIDEFKMLLISINDFEETDPPGSSAPAPTRYMERVTLRKSKSKITDVTQELSRITEDFPIVAGTKIGQIPRQPLPELKSLKIAGSK